MSNHVRAGLAVGRADPTRGGTAGLAAARTAAGFGAQVLLVERSRTGGDCLWTG